MRSFWIGLWAVALACGAWAAGGDAEVVHRERSLYQTILITRDATRLCLQFSVRENQRNQSCMDPSRRQRMVFTYTRMMMAVLLLNPQPRTVLMAGLGGGTLPTAFAELLPQATIDVVEIDAAVIAAARRFFGFETSDRLRVHGGDARVFVKRALQREQRYDVVLLDAYGGDYIPEHLTTAEFLAEARALLTPDGVLAANTFSTSRLYDHESETYRAVFGLFFNFKTPHSNNRVVIAKNGALPPKAVLRTNADAWHDRLRPYDVPIRSFPALLSLEVDWDTSKRPLTDQYAPANLLRDHDE